MINLLPEIQKEELEKEEKLKIISILGIIFLSSLLSLYLILFSIKVILNGKLETQKIIFNEREKELEVFHIEELEKEIKKYNSIFSKFNYFYQNQISFTDILEKLSKALPEKVYLKHLSLKPLTEENERADLLISGFCPDRETLIILKENLEKEREFSEVYFPPSNWLSPIDIDFSLTLKIKK